jgi:hypothetical protein
MMDESILEDCSASVGEGSKGLVVVLSSRLRLENIFDFLLNVSCQFGKDVKCFDSVS